jgi:hypothetical protein
MTDLNSSKHKRIFCFGCSFTHGHGSWAELLKRHFGDYPREDSYIPSDQMHLQRVHNFGKAGAGNYYIFNTIVEKSLEYNFTKDDLVLIEWSGVLREDRFKDGKWHCRGNVTNNDLYSPAVVRDWFLDVEGMMKRDYSYIHAIQKMLTADNIDYEKEYDICFIVFPLLDIDPRHEPIRHNSTFPFLKNLTHKIKAKKIIIFDNHDYAYVPKKELLEQLVFDSVLKRNYQADGLGKVEW